MKRKEDSADSLYFPHHGSRPFAASDCQPIGNGFCPPAYLFLIDRTRVNTPATNQAVAAVNAMPGRAAATMA